jgi:plastocyanin
VRPHGTGAPYGVALAAALIGLLLPAAGSARSSGAATPRTYTISLANPGYGPAPAQLRAGDTVVWVNNDLFRHTATARDGQFDVDLPPKARARTRLVRAGVVNVYCRYHPGMTLKLQVAR